MSTPLALLFPPLLCFLLPAGNVLPVLGGQGAEEEELAVQQEAQRLVSETEGAPVRDL